LDRESAPHMPPPTHRTTQQNKRTEYINIHVLSEIRTHDPSVGASEDSSFLRPRCHCDRPLNKLLSKYHGVNWFSQCIRNFRWTETGKRCTPFVQPRSYRSSIPWLVLQIRFQKIPGSSLSSETSPPYCSCIYRYILT
jgi:hypothetical protein